MRLLLLIHYFFRAYSIMLLVRIFSSWIPQSTQHPLIQWVYYYTEPYLSLFRLLIPPVAGTLDISPTIAFIALWLIERVVCSILITFFNFFSIHL